MICAILMSITVIASPAYAKAIAPWHDDLKTWMECYGCKKPSHKHFGFIKKHKKVRAA